MAHRATVNLKVLAGVAKPNPKMGQSLGPLGINMMQFCKEFNTMTTQFKSDVLLKVRLTAFTDRTFKFIIKPPETSWFYKRATKIQKFTSNPGILNYGSVSLQQLYEVAKIKKEMDKDMKDIQLEQILNMVVSQLGSCGLVYHSLTAEQAEFEEQDNATKMPLKK